MVGDLAKYWCGNYYVADNGYTNSPGLESERTETEKIPLGIFSSSRSAVQALVCLCGQAALNCKPELDVHIYIRNSKTSTL